ncbi:MAG: LEA type 2 family protein [Myxococcaceae bacterium]
MKKLCLLLAVVACRSAPPPLEGAPTLSGQEMVIAEQGLTDFLVRLEGQLQSPFPVRIDKASYEVVVEGQIVKKADAPLSISLGAGEIQPFSLEGGSRYVTSAEQLKEVSQKGGTLLTAIRGKLYAVAPTGQSFEVDFARSREIRVPRLPSVKLHEMDGARYSAEEVNAIFYLGVINPNPFPIRLNGLKYHVKMAGKELSDGVIGKGEKVSAAATGVFEVHADFNKETFGADAPKVIKGHNIPYEIAGELTGDLVKEPYALTGDLKLNVSK